MSEPIREQIAEALRDYKEDILNQRVLKLPANHTELAVKGIIAILKAGLKLERIDLDSAYIDYVPVVPDTIAVQAANAQLEADQKALEDMWK